MISPLRVFVGREHELFALEAGLQETQAGRGGLILLAGEAGIGKTRLADELAGRAAHAGFRVCWGRSWEVGGAPAYWPWIQVLRSLVREAGHSALPAGGLDSLGRLLPELGSAASRSGHDASQERFQLFDAVTSALCDAAQATPLLVILDDLHAANPSSLALLDFVARELRASRLCIVGTVRDQEARLSSENGELFARIAREATFLSLGRFGVEEVRALLGAVVRGSAPADELVREVARTTEGHPLFVEEMRRALSARSEPAAKGKLPVVDGVRAAIASRMSALPADARVVLEAAAVLGRDVPLDMLAALLERAAGELSEPLRAALAAGVLLEAEPGVLAFSHALVRDALYSDIAAERRASLHARAAELLERAGAPETAHGEIAQHLRCAVSAVGAERALAGAERAARRALSRYAFEDAAAILEQALAELEPKLSDRRALCCALILLGEARVRLHKDGREPCARAAALARELGDAQLLAEAALALGAEISIAVVSDVLVGLLQEALERLPTASLLRARVMARLAGAQQPAADPRLPLELARQAIALARELGDAETLRVVLYGAGSALADYAHPRERLDIDNELLRLAEQAQDRPQAFRARLRLFCDHLELGDTRAADATLRALGELAERLRRPRHRWYVAVLRAVRALASGQFAEAELHEASAQAEGAEREDPVLCTSYAMHRFGAAIVRYEDAWLEPRLAELPEMTSNLPVAALYRALWPGFVHARRGELKAAAARVAQLSVHEPLVHCEPSALQLLTEVYLACGTREQLAATLPYLERHRECFIGWGLFGLCLFGPFDGLIARAEAALGRFAEAATSFEAAIAEATAAGARPALAELHYQYARACFAEPHAASANLHQARGAELMRRARELARELGMPGLSERLQRLETEVNRAPAAELGAHLASAAAPGPSGAVSGAPALAVPFAAQLEFVLAREGDVWLVQRGNNTFRLKDSRGLHMLAELISQPGREMHVLTLGGGGDPGLLGDAGTVLDARAIAAYRTRLEALRDAEREAEELGNPERALAARQEIEQLAEQLSSGVGLGGRERRAGSVAERARTNVQRRIKDAIGRIEKCDPELGRYLGWTVRTGTFCVFDPGASKPASAD